MNYGPHNVARYQDGTFIDVTSEFEQDPNWDTVAYGGGPYARHSSSMAIFMSPERIYRKDIDLNGPQMLVTVASCCGNIKRIVDFH